MKGFVKTLESVVSVLLLLSVLSILFFSASSSYDWSMVSMKLAAYDTLNAFAMLNASLIKGNSYESASAIYSEMDRLSRIAVKMLPVARGLPRPNLVVVSDSEALNGELETYVGTEDRFMLGGINMSYIIAYNDTVSPSVLGTEEKYRYDAIFFTSDVGGYRDFAMEYIEQGGTLIIWNASVPQWVSSELGISPGSSASHSFMDTLSGYALSRMFTFTPVHSPLEFNLSDLAYHGNITLRGTLYGFTFSPVDACLNYSGTCYYPGDTFYVDGEPVYYQNSSGTKYVLLVIRNGSYVFSRSSSAGADSCLVGSAAGCLAAGKRIGNGALVWMMPVELSHTDFAQLVRAAVIWGASGVNYLHPGYYVTSNIHDIRGPSVEKPFESSRYVSASTLIPLDEWPVEMDLYVWSLY